MDKAWRWIVALTTASAMLLGASGAQDALAARAEARLEAGRMKNVQRLEEPPEPTAPPEEPTPTPAAQTAPAAASPAEAEVLRAVMDSAGAAQARETTITGGLQIKNETGFSVDADAIIMAGTSLRLPAEGPQILIIHTHGSEAYTPAGLDRYESDDVCRTADTNCNIVRVGDELARLLEEAGLRVLHDRELYDSPSYTGSYSRSGEAVERYLAQYPGIAVVLDVHRDALGAGDVVYKTMAEESGTVASQVMLLVGTDESGLSHPNWHTNLSLALYLQAAAVRKYPTLMRPVDLVPQRYNQHLSPGSLIVEVGSSGNTLQEALAAIRLFADAAAPALLELAEG